MVGIVTWFNVAKGYGEIYSESGETFFFTYLELPKVQKFRTIDRGKIVEFQAADERQFSLRTAKKIKAFKASTKKADPVLERLRSLLP